MSEALETSPPVLAEVVNAEVVDAEVAAPQGIPCDSCGSPVEQGDRFCPACGAVQAETAPAAKAGDAPVLVQKHIRCETCGAEVATDLDQRSYICPFCDSTYVVEYSPEVTGRHPPEFVIGFAVSREQAMEKFRTWLNQNNWFRPGDLSKSAQIDEKMNGVYLPFWSFSLLAQSRWQATVGEHWYRTETYTTTDSKGNRVTRTRRVQETEWWPLAGRHHRYYSGYLISGSRGLTQAEAEQIKPFSLPALKRYEPYFLAGWINEEYSIDRAEALETSKRVFYGQEQANIAKFLPGDTHRQLQISTEFSQINSDLCLLPVYVLRYRYKEKLYRFLVNGQTGKLSGAKPYSPQRIAAGVGLALGVIALIVIVVLLLNGAFGG